MSSVFGSHPERAALTTCDHGSLRLFCKQKDTSSHNSTFFKPLYDLSSLNIVGLSYQFGESPAHTKRRRPPQDDGAAINPTPVPPAERGISIPLEGNAASQDNDTQRTKHRKKKQNAPPETYLCNICHVKGHWLRQCPKRAAEGDTTPRPTVLCKHFMDGSCHRGAECSFSHEGTPAKKTDPCRFFVGGYCTRDNDCLFNHNLPCQHFFQHGRCRFGEECRFSHAPLTDSMRVLLDRLAAPSPPVPEPLAVVDTATAIAPHAALFSSSILQAPSAPAQLSAASPAVVETKDQVSQPDLVPNTSATQPLPSLGSGHDVLSMLRMAMGQAGALRAGSHAPPSIPMPAAPLVPSSSSLGEAACAIAPPSPTETQPRLTPAASAPHTRWKPPSARGRRPLQPPVPTSGLLSQPHAPLGLRTQPQPPPPPPTNAHGLPDSATVQHLFSLSDPTASCFDVE